MQAEQVVERAADTPGEPTLRGSSEGKHTFVQRYAGLMVLVAMIVVFSILEPASFPTYNNAVGILANSAILGILALGLLIPLAAGVFDISIGGMMTLAVVAVTWLFQVTEGRMPVSVAILIVLVGALLVGLGNSWLVVDRGVDPFVGTIGVGSVLIGLSQLLANGTTITNDIPGSFTSFGRFAVDRIPIGVFILLVLCAIGWYVLQYTPFGRLLYATGASREAARLTGIRTARIIRIAFICSALGAAIAGIVFAARLGAGPPGIGVGYLIGAYSVAFLGSTIIHPGRFNVGGTIVALLIISIGINGLQITGLPFWVVETFQGLALIVAVLLGRPKIAK